jgi:hypothetical protein
MADDLGQLQRDIEGLLEANRLDWLELAAKPMCSHERFERRKVIVARDVNLLELLQRKWALEEAQHASK